MKLIMAVSKDGYVARSEADKMTWTGHQDKKVFKLLTMVGGGPLGAGRTTAELLPQLLGRRVVKLSRTEDLNNDVMTLERFHARHGDTWLIGGQTVALAAIEAGYVDELFLCHSPNLAHGGAAADHRLLNFGQPVGHVDFGELRVEVRR